MIREMCIHSSLRTVFNSRTYMYFLYLSFRLGLLTKCQTCLYTWWIWKEFNLSWWILLESQQLSILVLMIYQRHQVCWKLKFWPLVHKKFKKFRNFSDEFVKPALPPQVMRRSFVKGQNGVRGSPDVKISEEQSDKSGTDPEDTDENYSQADITDYRNYEQIFRFVINSAPSF